MLELPETELPEPEPGAWYGFQLVGLEVEEEGGRRLGKVVAVEPGVANDVLELSSGESLPAVTACIRCGRARRRPYPRRAGVRIARLALSARRSS